MNKSTSHFIQLFGAIVVMSSSGTIARAVEISPEMAIWVRSVLASLALLAVLLFTKTPLWTGPGKPFKVVVLSTILFAVHWVTYFYALYYSSVAVGMLSLFTYPVMTALLEPIIVKTKLNMADVFFSVLAFSGVYFLVPSFDLDNEVTQGVMIGLVSALAYSLRNLLLKLHVKEHSGITLMFMQLVGISILLSPIFFNTDINLHISMIGAEWMPLVLLGLGTTALGHTLFVVSFKNFSITTISILSSLTPLLGIGLGIVFLDEIPDGNVWIGGALISVAVVAESLKAMKK